MTQLEMRLKAWYAEGALIQGLIPNDPVGRTTMDNAMYPVSRYFRDQYNIKQPVKKKETP